MFYILINNKGQPRCPLVFLENRLHLIQMLGERLLETGPDLAGLGTVLTDMSHHRVVIAVARQIGQLTVEAQRRGSGLGGSKVNLANPGIESLEAVEDQGIDGIAGGKGQTVVELVVKVGERFAIIG